MTFHDQKDKSEKTVQVPIGQSLLEAAHNNDIDLEGGLHLRTSAHITFSVRYFNSMNCVCTAVQVLVKALWPAQRVMW